MTARKPRLDEVVSALTARLASAHEIREHAERLMALAAAQVDEARREARETLGDAGGERLFQTVSSLYERAEGDESRVPEVPGLRERLAAPWESPADAGHPAAPGDGPAASPASLPRDTTGPVPAVPAAAPVDAPVPHPAPVAPAAPVAAEPPPPAPPRAQPPPAALVAPAPTILHGQTIDPGNLGAAQRIVKQARDFVANGDAAQYDGHGAKWVGVHQWRRDLFRAAFVDAAREAGLALPGEEAPGTPAPAGAVPVPVPVPPPPRGPDPVEAAERSPSRPAEPRSQAAPPVAGLIGEPPGSQPEAVEPHPPASWDPRPVAVPAPPADLPGPAPAVASSASPFEDPDEAEEMEDDGHPGLDPEEDDIVFGADEEPYPAAVQVPAPPSAFQRPSPPAARPPSPGLPGFLRAAAEDDEWARPAQATPTGMRPALPPRPSLPVRPPPFRRP